LRGESREGEKVGKGEGEEGRGRRRRRRERKGERGALEFIEIRRLRVE
jgi:hypothetical protein